MEKFDVYKDIAERTDGDVYIGVVGPVRTGKSTFITKFMEKLVIPNISNKFQRQIATDEMPQSADGRTIMTTQPKFVPANSVKVQFKNKVTANIRLVDCVGYFVDGASGHEEGDKPRLVKTPWSDEEMPFFKAAEVGTEKVIDEYSTIGVMITTDGSFGDIPRENYVSAEEKVVKKLKDGKKPFVIVLNTSKPTANETTELAGVLEDKYGVSVVPVSCADLSAEDIESVMEKVLLEFPINGFNVNVPEWMRALPCDSPIIEELTSVVKSASANMEKMRDFTQLDGVFSDSQSFEEATVCELNLGTGFPCYSVKCKDDLFYKVLSSECGETIDDEYSLMSFVKSFSDSRRHYLKIKDALDKAEEEGYGVVMPTLDEMNLEEPIVVKNGGKYGVKLKASAPSLHIMKVDVSTEVAPIVGTEKQGEELVNFIMNRFQDNPAGIWDTNMFGKPLHELVNEGLAGKLNSMPKETQGKMRKTVTRIVNENRGGVICILL